VIKISQGPYIKRFLKGRGWMNLNRVGSPLNIYMKYDPEFPELDKKVKEEYLEMVRSAQ
jgi:hypothetical protein